MNPMSAQRLLLKRLRQVINRTERLIAFHEREGPPQAVVMGALVEAKKQLQVAYCMLDVGELALRRRELEAELEQITRLEMLAKREQPQEPVD